MSELIEALAGRITERFGARVTRLPSLSGDLAFEVGAGDLRDVAEGLRTGAGMAFEQLIDVAGIDSVSYTHLTLPTIYSV